MTPLAKLLVARIIASGPITMAQFMADCLLHPEHGYYSTMQPFGTEGDFITAPEISQMFGELLGLALAQAWMDQGSPNPFILAEIGPGRGTLMADVLRATAKVRGFHAGAKVHLVEASARLQAVQAETLPDCGAKWVAGVTDLPHGPLFLLANEFFDALPVRQFVRHRNGWQECLIRVQNGALEMRLSDPVVVDDLKNRMDDTGPGDVVELCAAAGAFMGQIAGRIGDQGGAAIVIDYGGWRSLGDTVQAVRAHEYENPLANPGQADITAHVDFEALVTAADGVMATGLTNQGDLLNRLGIEVRHRTLATNLTGDALHNHDAALTRLTHSDEMGTLFKAVGFYPASMPPPPGFEP